ncbi:MAG: ABC-type transport system involved in multi-copper enzyme maturation permease subunit [Rhodothermales bacterium]|jgi:ABC-type transport system involved in multi-copper enzyme maturation permease subunit
MTRLLPNLALFRRTLMLDCRHWLTYALRFLLVVAMLPALAIFASWSKSQAVGLVYFKALMLVNFIFISLAGLTFFASAVSEEREEQTLEMLALSGIAPGSLLLAKSTSRLLSGVLLLCAQLPMTMLAITLGGVGPWQILCCYVTLLAYMVFLSNLALVASVIAPRTIIASAAILLSLLGLYGIPYLIKFALGFTITTRIGLFLDAITDAWLHFCPIPRLNEIIMPGFRGEPFGSTVWLNLAAGVLLFLIAVALFRWNFGRDTRSAGRRYWRRFVPKLPVRVQARLQAARVWERGAVVWKDFHHLNGGRRAVALKTIVLLGIFLFSIVIVTGGLRMAMDERFQFAMLGKLMVITAALLGVGELILICGRIFSHELRRGTFIGLMTLPIDLRTLIAAKLGGGFLSLLPTAIYGLIGVLLIAPSFADFATVLGHRAFWASLFSVLLLAHLALACSLYMRWGAVACSLLFYGSTAVFGLAICRGALHLSVTVIIWLGIVGALAGILALQRLIGFRLRQLASR